MDLNNLRWRKSSRSGQNGDHCIELATVPGTVAVRDSKDPEGPKLLVDRAEFRHFAAAIRAI
ncbi:hypothetical protein BTM25_02310 [Actinomadura rubteroloni]|uniref:DUF397 domain-containing protein n=1 Tax=Actinomadura rubteroloni TaxID=1926885 RepID=A0A2P4ULB6_9ACTN|nr:DUF397 domain-containing protein [Actinomadura rubteroloni]POM25848.1 hypothetical protein BTM25_02310 [Actinomadura rubteroloni]